MYIIRNVKITMFNQSNLLTILNMVFGKTNYTKTKLKKMLTCGFFVLFK